MEEKELWQAKAAILQAQITISENQVLIQKAALRKQLDAATTAIAALEED